LPKTPKIKKFSKKHGKSVTYARFFTGKSCAFREFPLCFVQAPLTLGKIAALKAFIGGTLLDLKTNLQKIKIFDPYTPIFGVALSEAIATELQKLNNQFLN